MKNLTTLIGKELRLYFVSPIVYVITAVFLVIVDYMFYAQTVFYSSVSAQMMRFQGNLPSINLHSMVFFPTLMNAVVILMFIMPLVTMRLLSEEKKTRTDELLLSAPVTVMEVILGKFIAAMVIYMLMLGLTLHLPLGLGWITTLTAKPLMAAYLGLILIGSMFLATGLFASALTENQIVAALISFGMLIGFWLSGSASPPDAESPVGAAIRHLSVVEHVEDLMKGLIDTSDLVYFISITLLGLFLAHRAVSSQRGA